MEISPWIPSKDRRPTQADLPVELYFGQAFDQPACRGPVVAEYLTVEQASMFGRPGARYVDQNRTFTHWRQYRPLTPEQLTVEPAKGVGELGGLGSASVAAYKLVVRAGRVAQKGPSGCVLAFETVARELEKYADDKADKAVENFKAVMHTSKDSKISELTIANRALNNQLVDARQSARIAVDEATKPLHAKIEELKQMIDLDARVDHATPKLQIEPASSRFGPGAASLGAFLLADRINCTDTSWTHNGNFYSRGNGGKIEALARLIEAYAKKVADKSIGDFKMQSSTAVEAQLTQLRGAEQSLRQERDSLNNELRDTKARVLELVRHRAELLARGRAPTAPRSTRSRTNSRASAMISTRRHAASTSSSTSRTRCATR